MIRVFISEQWVGRQHHSQTPNQDTRLILAVTGLSADIDWKSILDPLRNREKQAA